MKRISSILKDNSATIITGVMAIVVFYIVYGTRILNPSNVDWLMNRGDSTQHYIGWLAYRNSDWFFPFGLFNTLTYPSQASIIFVDAIPLLANVFKLISPILPDTFQYLGIWIMLCLTLQGVIASIIIKKFYNSNIIIIIASMFFVCSPVMLHRFLCGHEALGAHWIVLLALSILVYNDHVFVRKYDYVIWTTIGVLTATVHMYFVPMCGIILLGYIVAVNHEKKDIKKTCFLLCVYILSALMATYLEGGFSTWGSSYQESGLRVYSFNLNGFFNAQSMSRFNLTLPICFEGQVGGFAYLGLGMLVFISISLFLFIERNIFNKNYKITKKLAPYVLIFIISLLVAISPLVTFGNKVLFDVPIPNSVETLWSIFRGTGRFIWPCYYIVMIAAFWLMSKCKISSNVIVIMLTGCFLIQFYDVSYFIQVNKPLKYSINYNDFSNDKDVWAELAKEKRHIVFSPDLKLTAEKYYEFGHYALGNKMSLNYFSLAHNTGKIPPITNFQENTAYIFDKEHPQIEYKMIDELYIYDGGDYFIGTLTPLISQDNVLLRDYFPQYYLGENLLENFNYCYAKGISEREQEFTWTDGNEVDILIYLNQTDFTKLKLLMKIRAPYNGKQRMTMSVDEQVYAPYILEQSQTIEVTFEKGENNFVHIQLELPDAISPAQMSQSIDSRLLGLAIESIVIDGVE